MKRNKAFIHFLLIIVLLAALAGCVKRDASVPAPGVTPGPEDTAPDAPTATPEPTSAPLEYGRIAEFDPPEHDLCGSDADVFAALETIRANAANAPAAASVLGGAKLDGSEIRGDKVAVGGDRICLISDKDLIIVRAAGEETQLLSKTHVGIDWKGETDAVTGAYQGSEKVPFAVFCEGDRLAVLSDRYGYRTENGLMKYTEFTAADLYDISDPTAPKLLSSLGQDGSLRAAFTVNGKLLLITEYLIYDDASAESAGSYIPAYYTDERPELLPGDRIRADRKGSFPGGALMGLYDLSDARLTDIRALMGVSADAAADESGAFVLYSARHAEAFSRDVDTSRGREREIAYSDVTDLFVFRPEGDEISLAAVGTVNGAISDSGCLDLGKDGIRCLAAVSRGRYTEMSGADRVSSEKTEGTAVFLLDEELKTADTLDSLPDGSRIGWAGFAGERLLLTAEDRSSSCVYDAGGWGEPSAEALTGRYLRAWGDSLYVLYELNAQSRMTITFCDRNMKPAASKTFASDHSSTLENHRAYITDAGRDLLTFTADDSYCIYGYDAEKGIVLRSDVFLNDWAWNAKGLLVGELLYIADGKEIIVLSAETLETLTELTF